jgi:hypothetical protein
LRLWIYNEYLSLTGLQSPALFDPNLYLQSSITLLLVIVLQAPFFLPEP